MSRQCRLVTIASTALLLAGVTNAQQTASEYQVKAAYLYNFAKSAEWPSEALPNPDTALVLCVFGGGEDFMKTLQAALAGKAVRGHPLEIRHGHSAGELKDCHLIFVRASERNPRTILGEGRGGILLVGEDKDFLNQGGMINLVLIDGRIGYEINPESLERAGIRYGGNASLSSRSQPAGSSIQSEGSRSLKNSRPPQYPDLARQMSLRGTVQLQAVVRADGTVKEIRAIGGHPLLVEAASQAVKQWRYEPASKETMETVKINFGQ